jgi:hypothetical protein
VHNWASHAADAFRYLSLAWRDPILRDEPKLPPEYHKHIRLHDPTPVAISTLTAQSR